MIEQLFGSKTRVKLLQLFFGNPNRPYYVREITRKIDEQINSVRRELANLLNIGIITSETNNNRLYYEVNQKYEYYQPLHSMFGHPSKVVAEKTVAPSPTNTAKQDNPLKALGNVMLIVYTGVFTRDESSGVDVLVVGDINQTQLSKYMAELEKQESKELRYTAMTPSEFQYRQQVKDRFVTQLLAAKMQVVLDKDGVIEKLNMKGEE